MTSKHTSVYLYVSELEMKDFMFTISKANATSSMTQGLADELAKVTTE